VINKNSLGNDFSMKKPVDLMIFMLTRQLRLPVQVFEGLFLPSSDPSN
jgi:hypothetical protein